MDRKPKTKLKINFWISFAMLHINLLLWQIVPDISKDWFFILVLFEGCMAITWLLLSIKLGEWKDDKSN